jgi:hypothetical protein
MRTELAAATRVGQPMGQPVEGALGSRRVRPEGRMSDQEAGGMVLASSGISSLVLIGLGLGAMWIVGAVKWAKGVPGSAEERLGKLLFGVGFGLAWGLPYLIAYSASSAASAGIDQGGGSGPGRAPNLAAISAAAQRAAQAGHNLQGVQVQLPF